MAGKTISEKILSAKSGVDAHAGDVVVCRVDGALGTDASVPMAIDYFEAMGGERVRDPEKLAFALDHYAPPPNRDTTRLHTRTRDFARAHGIHLWEVGDGIGHQLMVESGAKQFKARFSGPGMRWTRSGAQNLLPIRSAILSHTFDQLFAAAIALPPN